MANYNTRKFTKDFSVVMFVSYSMLSLLIHFEIILILSTGGWDELVKIMFYTSGTKLVNGIMYLFIHFIIFISWRDAIDRIKELRNSEKKG